MLSAKGITERKNNVQRPCDRREQEGAQWARKMQKIVWHEHSCSRVDGIRIRGSSENGGEGEPDHKRLYAHLKDLFFSLKSM